MTRVVCFIPSITETLLDCGVDVVGRTRFCIHPNEKVKDIKVVGGTKDVKWDKLTELKPDLVILDKEENTLEMAEACPCPFFTLHITSLANISSELLSLANKLNNSQLKEIAYQWKQIADSKALNHVDLNHIPGAISYLGEVNHQKNLRTDLTKEKVDYLIWKDPWMAIGPETFIWSVLCKLGFSERLIRREEKYPNIDSESLPRDNCFYLFSSEPFPFEKHLEELNEMNFAGALIDGELYSWYGTRSLRFLQSELKLS